MKTWGRASCTQIRINKGTVSRDFRLYFQWNSFPQAPGYSIRAISIFFQKVLIILFGHLFGKIRNDPNVIFWTLGKMIHEKTLKQKVSWHCPYKAVSFNEEYSTHGSGELILLSVVYGVKITEAGKLNSETNRQKTAKWQKTGKPTVKQR